MREKQEEKNNFDSFLYGPVLSRRFGYSLGIDLVPFKVCTYDCIYCQLGRTTKKTTKRADYANIKNRDFEQRLKEKLDNTEKIDYITFSGSGEPTLNIKIKDYIDIAKNLSDIPVLLLTGGGLLWSEEVVKDIKEADVVKVSLDAPNRSLFKKINRPAKGLGFSKILYGLKNLEKNYKGKVWLEIMIMENINDSTKLAVDFDDIINIYCKDVEKIHLNTPTRSSGTRGIRLPDRKKLENIKEILGPKASIIQEVIKSSKDDEGSSPEKEEIIKLIKIRPSSVSEISSSLDLNRNLTVKLMTSLVKEGRVKVENRGKKRLFYI